MRLYHEEIKYSITLHNSITIRTHISITDYSIQNYCYAVMLCNASINIQTYHKHTTFLRDGHIVYLFAHNKKRGLENNYLSKPHL